MLKTFGLALLLGATLASVAIQQDQGHLAASDPLSGLESLTASGKHKSWCSFKAGAAKIWCQSKAYATIDKIKRQINLDNCAYNYNLALQQCPKRRLEQSVSKMAQKHKSWCTFKAAVANKWCQTKALATLDSVKRQYNLGVCATKYAAEKNLCPQRRLEKLFGQTAQKHKSWCTFKAGVSRTWCKTKAIRFDSATRNAGFMACDNAYNLSVARCAQRRLMRDMEKAILAGNAHEGWCEFKNRSKWLWCKATKSINVNAASRAQSLAKCDAEYNLGNALCKNEATTVVVSTSSSTTAK